MLSELKPIHFSTDLIFPPFDLSTAPSLDRHRGRIREVFEKVRGEKGIEFNELNVHERDGPHLVTRGGSGNVRSYSFLPDRIRARDEWTERTLGEFAREVKEMVDVCFRVFSIPIIVSQSCVIRATAKPHGYEDSREFLFDHGLNISGKRVADLFGRPAHVAGIAIAFPLMKDTPDAHRVRIESYGRDPSLVFLEVSSSFHANPIPANDQDRLEKNLESCYEFMETRVRAFVDSLYETKGEGGQ